MLKQEMEKIVKLMATFNANFVRGYHHTQEGPQLGFILLQISMSQSEKTDKTVKAKVELARTIRELQRKYSIIITPSITSDGYYNGFTWKKK